MSTSTTLFDNKITRAIEAMTIRVQALDPAAQADLSDNATLSMSDLLAFGEFPSRGMLAGLLTVDEATRLHAIRSDFDSATVAERVVFLMVMDELVKAGV